MAGMRGRLALLLALLLTPLLSGCGGEAAGEGIPEYLVAVAGQGVYGSGVIYSMDEESLHVLTAAHVIEGARIEEKGSVGLESVEDMEADPIVVRFCDGWEAACTELAASEKADLAFISVPVSEISEERRRLYQCVKTDKESFDALKAGDGCTALGLEAGGRRVSCAGNILEPWIYMEDYGQYMIWAQAGIRPGMSGGGLFDDGGCFIGLLSGGNGDGELAAVPLSLILQFVMETFG